MEAILDSFQRFSEDFHMELEQKIEIEDIKALLQLMKKEGKDFKAAYSLDKSLEAITNFRSEYLLQANPDENKIDLLSAYEAFIDEEESEPDEEDNTRNMNLIHYQMNNVHDKY